MIRQADEAAIVPTPLVDSAAGRGLAVLRLVALAYAIGVAVVNRDSLLHVWPVVIYFVVIAIWSVVAPLLPRPTIWATLAELSLAITGILLTSVVYSAADVAAGISTIPTIWSAAGVMAAALYGGISGGLLGAGAIAAANLLQADPPNRLTYHNILLLFLVGLLVGFGVRQARANQVRLEAALRARERLAERERIGRQVHDGVLQVLALINRRGRDLGDPGRELAELAAEQERSLRDLITRFEPSAEAGLTTETGPEVDLATLLAARRAATVEIVLPAGPVSLPRHVATELDAAVGAALANVAGHAGEGARAWVLLDADGDDLEIVVRDDGVGMGPDRLVEAAAQGRLGASSSIRGRLQELGGEATWRSPASGGCVVTLTVPRDPAWSPSEGRDVGGSPHD